MHCAERHWRNGGLVTDEACRESKRRDRGWERSWPKYDDDDDVGSLGVGYLVRLLCAEFDVCSVNVAVPDATHGGVDLLFVTGCFSDGGFDTR